jgi:hypothetical protein
MKSVKKGWLKDYLEFRKELHKDLGVNGNKGSHPEHSLYRIIQPTGLMYGQSVGNLEHPDENEWDQRDKMKILLAESLISSSLLFQDKPVSSPDELSDVIIKTLDSIGNFYNKIFPELSTSTRTIFGRKKSALDIAEKILDKRIEHTEEYASNFWVSFFHNSLLFLEVFIFGQWIHTNADKIVEDFFRYERDELRFSVLKVIAAAAHANDEIAFEEKKLFDLFLDSTTLTAERKAEAHIIFDNGIEIESIDLPSENSWILKKFFLEMAILTLWADKKVEQSEQDFLRRFCDYLNFSEEDLENSLIAIEGFVLEHWGQLDRLQDKQDFDSVSEQFIKRVARIAEKNQSKLIRGIHERRDILDLLTKAKSNELSADEMEHMRKELIVILKTIPTFVITSLPNRFLTLPILLKILPRDIFKKDK